MFMSAQPDEAGDHQLKAHIQLMKLRRAIRGLRTTFKDSKGKIVSKNEYIKRTKVALLVIIYATNQSPEQNSPAFAPFTSEVLRTMYELAKACDMQRVQDYQPGFIGTDSEHADALGKQLNSIATLFNTHFAKDAFLEAVFQPGDSPHNQGLSQACSAPYLLNLLLFYDRSALTPHPWTEDMHHVAKLISGNMLGEQKASTIVVGYIAKGIGNILKLNSQEANSFLSNALKRTGMDKIIYSIESVPGCTVQEINPADIRPNELRVLNDKFGLSVTGAGDPDSAHRNPVGPYAELLTPDSEPTR
jgi:hypothetical protein